MALPEDAVLRLFNCKVTKAVQGVRFQMNNFVCLADENPWLDAVKKLSAPVPEKWMRPGVYVAVLADAPFVEPGMAGMREFKAESVVYGVMPPKGEAQ